MPRSENSRNEANNEGRSFTLTRSRLTRQSTEITEVQKLQSIPKDPNYPKQDHDVEA